MPTSYNYFKDDIKQYLVENLNKNAKILDAGPGIGTYSMLLKDYGFDIDAVEIYEPYVKKYNLKDKYKNVFVRSIIGFDISPYDFVILGDVLEHISIKDAQMLIDSIISQNKGCLVAIPYMMEQGEHEGNIHETHLQPDLTPKIMEDRYPELELLYGSEYYGYYINKKPKYEKAFILYADDSYFDLVDACCRSIRNFSSYPILVYMLNSDKKVSVIDTTTIRWDCDVIHLNKRKDFIDREDKQIYKLLIERPKIVQHALENYAEVVAYVDTDSIANKNIDNVFSHFNYGSDYPYFTKGIYDFLIINGRGGASSYDDLSSTLEAPLCNLFNSDQKQRQFTGYRQTGYFVAGQNCIDFLELWYYRCNHPSIFKNNSFYAPYNEESVLQTLLYDYKAIIGLPYCYINGLHKDLEYKDQEYFIKEWQKVPLKDNHYFWHGEKNIKKIKEFMKKLLP